MTAEVEIRPGSTDDLTVLVTVLGERHWFTDRLARVASQERCKRLGAQALG